MMNIDQFHERIKKTLQNLGEDEQGTIKIDFMSAKVEPISIPIKQDKGIDTEFKSREKIAILVTVKVYIDNQLNEVKPAGE